MGFLCVSLLVKKCLVRRAKMTYQILYFMLKNEFNSINVQNNKVGPSHYSFIAISLDPHISKYLSIIVRLSTLQSFLKSR